MVVVGSIVPLLLALPLRPVSVAAAVRRCASVACERDGRAVRLHYARSLRSLLKPARRSELLHVEPDVPLSSLHAALSERLGRDLPASAVYITHGRRKIESESDLRAVIAAAYAHGVDPHLRVESDLPAPEAAPAEPVAAAELDGEPKQLLSFYAFVPIDEGRRPLLALQLSRALSWLGALGSVYLAAEGANAQLALPASRVPQLRAELDSLPELAGTRLNLGAFVAPEERPYRRLLVRQKAQVLTDGLGAPLDWARSGRELEPAEWHEALSTLPADAVLLDCRNGYETALGSFDHATPLGTSVFSESWDALRTQLQATPRDAPVYTFCTGGIRCVKVNAWLESELGFTTTHRLGDGIHGYLRYVEEQTAAPATDVQCRSHWRGANFVFYAGAPRELDEGVSAREPPGEREGGREPGAEVRE